MIAGIVYPNNGEIRIDETEVTRQISEKVAYLTELDMFYQTFTVQKMVVFYASQFQDFDIEKANQLLKDMKIDPTKKIKQLSKRLYVLCRDQINYLYKFYYKFTV